MSEKKYWKGLEQLNNTPAYQESLGNEFREELPMDLGDSLLNAATPRRDFLKYLGYSTAAAMLAASCEMPVRKAIPYAIKPEDVVPGVANYYASTFIDGGEWCPIIVKTRDGRPIKIEGNELSSITRGATTARVQASVLNLYDTARLRGPHSGGKQVEMWSAIDGAIGSDIAAQNGKKAYLLTSTIISPTVMEAIRQYIAKYPNTTHVMWDPISFSGALNANQASYGKRALPSYRFDKAATIVSLGADFLGTWLSPAEFAKQYSFGRKISAKHPRMSRHYQFEAMHTVTGASSDTRVSCRPSEMGTIAVALYNALNGGASTPGLSPAQNAAVAKAAADLSKGNGLVVCGSNDVAVQTVVNAINSKIGANGTTIDWALTNNTKQGNDAAMVNLVADMNNGNVGVLMMHGVNPVYEYFDGTGFAAAMKKVPVTVSFADRLDETSALCKYITPDHNYLESWGDAEPKPGFYSLMQPAISPLFKTRAFPESLMAWSGNTTRYADAWIAYWTGKLGGQSNFDKALQDGIIEPGNGGMMAAVLGGQHSTTDSMAAPGTGHNVAPVTSPADQRAGGNLPNPGGASFSGDVAGAIAAIGAAKPAGGLELVVYEKVSIGKGGAWSNNPWLQELPDPITKATWDNYACVSPLRAKKLDEGKGQDIELTGINEVDTAKRVIKLTVNGKSVELPAIVVPGLHNDVIAVAVGYGRAASVGRAAASGDDINGKRAGGRNAYPFMRWNAASNSFVTDSPGLQVAKVDQRYDVAITQTHHSYEGRGIIREFTLAEFAAHPDHLLKEREEEIGKYASKPWESKEQHHENAGVGVSEGTHDNGTTNGDHGHNAGHGTLAAGAVLPEKDFEQGFRENGTLYPDYQHLGIHWGMSIDLNACIGCGACVIACQSENNVAVVGKDKVLLAQEMHWLTIDRYFTGDPDNSDSIQTVFQPMMCQHCDNAPCENVCPVSATNHSSEGLNQMAYNRCIGTKYCANNCPYKVRHFNWMDWNGADCFDDNDYEDGRRDDMNDSLTRMVLNPDVTVRSRGVMEKCTFCVQRLQEAKLTAKKDGRPVVDGEARTACQQACPTNVIVFGNVNDKNSAIHNLRKSDQRERTYYLLEEIHTLPNVNYLSKVRNTEAIMGGNEKTDKMMTEHI